MVNNFSDKVNFIWSVADLLRGPYRPNQYKDVMLPLTVLRRLDCVLEPTKDDVLAANKKWSSRGKGVLDAKLIRASAVPFYNTSRYTFEKLKGDPDNIAANLTNYIKGFSAPARRIIEHFGFDEQIAKLDKADRLFLILSKFCEIDLHPYTVSAIEMGYIFEELIRKFNEASNEEAGDHFTPREVIRLMVNLIFMPDEDVLTTKGIVKTLFDPACGTGGMLSVAQDYLRELNPDASLEAFGQDYNDDSFAVCGSDMMIKGQDIDHIAFGDSFTEDHFSGKTFDYMLANPPFGVEWKPEANVIKREHEEQGFGGRFGAGLPRINDGSLLFLQHMIDKMKPPQDGGTRLAIVFNRSPLYAGDAGSGESEIRHWLLSNDWLEAIVALPTSLFYNTGIPTYLWVVTNRKLPHRKGYVQLIDATRHFTVLRKSLNEKKHELTDTHIDEITKCYEHCNNSQISQVFKNEAFMYKRLTIEQPLRQRFSITAVGIDMLQTASPFTTLAKSKKRDKRIRAAEERQGRDVQRRLLDILTQLKDSSSSTSRTNFIEYLRIAAEKEDLRLSPALYRSMAEAFSQRDEDAEVSLDSQGQPIPDPALREYEHVPVGEDTTAYFDREVKPYAPDSWIAAGKDKMITYIPFHRYFVRPTTHRRLRLIAEDLKSVTAALSSVFSKGKISE